MPYLDAHIVREKHDQSVNPKAPAGSWWESILEGSNEVVVDWLGLIVSSCLGLHLVFKKGSLDEGVIQLSVGIDDFVVVHEQLESLGQMTLVSVVLGQRAHDLRMVHDECWVFASRLNEFPDHLFENQKSPSKTKETQKNSKEFE